MKNLLIIFVSIVMISLSGCSELTTIQKRIYTDNQWEEDIDYLNTHFTRTHPDPYRNISKEQWNENISSLKSDLKNLSDQDIAFRIQSLLSTLKDCHTSVNPQSIISSYDKTIKNPADILTFPLEFKWFEDEIVVSSTEKNNENLLGSTLISINDISVDEILEKLSHQISYDNNQSLKSDALYYIKNYEMLDYLKIIDSTKAEFKFKTNSNKYISTYIEPKQYKNVDYISIDSKILKTPITKIKPSGKSDYYWAKNIEEDSILYFQFNKCISRELDGASLIEDKNIPSVYEFTDELINLINNSKFDKFVVDLRENRGGNSDIIKYILTRIDSLTNLKTNAKTYVLTSKNTNSAAVSTTIDIVNNLDATVIGEETGGNVNSYKLFSSSNEIILPNSQIAVTISKSFVDKIIGYEGGFKPDIQMFQTYDDYFKGIDTCYEFIKKE